MTAAHPSIYVSNTHLTHRLWGRYIREA